MAGSHEGFEFERGLFVDREDAGRHLARALERYRSGDTLVLGIPRGGVPVAIEVARHLHAMLDIIVARKLGAPGYPELAIGAVTSNGGRYLNEELIREIGVSQDYVQRVTENEMAEAHRREARFRADQPAMVVEARTALIVDDGLATGATMRAAVRSVRQRHPARLVVAVPVGSVDACEALRAEADDVVCLNAPIDFVAVGYYFRNFAPVEDEAVVRMLDEARSASAAGAETHAQ